MHMKCTDSYFRVPCPKTCIGALSNGNLLCTIPEYKDKPRKKFTMTGSDWIKVTDFTASVGWDFLFDINVLKRSGDIERSIYPYQIFLWGTVQCIN